MGILCSLYCSEKQLYFLDWEFILIEIVVNYIEAFYINELLFFIYLFINS